MSRAARARAGSAPMPAAIEDASPLRQRWLTTICTASPASSRSRRGARAPSTTTQPAGTLASATRAMRRSSVSRPIRRSCFGLPKRRDPPAASRMTQGRAIIVRMRKEYASLRRRPLLAPVWLAALGGILVTALGFWLVTAASTTTVFVIRHAEKLTVNPEDRDPPLAPAGEARALELAQLFGRAPKERRLDAIFVTELRRTQDTVRPLTIQLGVPMIVVPAKEPETVAK